MVRPRSGPPAGRRGESERDVNQENGREVVFREVQTFRQVWIWVIVVALASLMWYTLVQQLLLGSPVGENPMPDLVLVIFWLVFGIGLPALFVFSRLVTEVRNDGIYIRYIPFHRSFRRIGFEQLRRYEVRTYRPLAEYGGWGIRYGFKGKGRAYNVSGNRGVQIELSNGKRLLIGSQRPEDLVRAIETKRGHKNHAIAEELSDGP